MSTIRQFTGATLIRAEFTDGRRVSLADDNPGRAIEHGETKFRAMPPQVIGDMVEQYLYRALGLDRARFVFDLPGSVKGVGSHRSGTGGHGGGDRHGFVFRRGNDGKADGEPVGRIAFLTTDQKTRDGDPQDRHDFEAFR
jgi:hypothetical protein